MANFKLNNPFKFSSFFNNKQSSPKSEKKVRTTFNKTYGILEKVGNSIRFGKIHIRLMVSFIAISIIPLIITGFLSYNNTSKAISNKIQTYSVQVVDQLKSNIGFEMSKLEELTTEFIFSPVVQENLSKLENANEIEKLEINRSLSSNIASKVTTSNTVTYFGIIIDGSFGISYGTSPSEDEVKEILNLVPKEGNPVWILANSKGIKVPFICRTIRSTLTSKTLGTLVLALKHNYFSEIYKKVELGDSSIKNNKSDIFITDPKGIVISSLNPDFVVGEPFKDSNFINKISQNKNASYLDYSLNKRNYLVAYSQLTKNVKWNVVSLVPYSYLNSESNDIKDSIVSYTLVCFVFAILLSFLIAKSISTPLNKLIGAMKEAKDGNLTIKLDDVSSDEISQVAHNFSEMLLNINALVSKVQASAESVISNAEKISLSSNRSYEVSEQVAVTIQQIAKGASDQASEISDGVIHINHLSEGINKVGNDMGSVAEVAYNTRRLSEEAFKTVRELNEKAEQTTNASQKIVDDIDSLNNDMKEIKKIVKVIVSIAEQTNLLSLNAAIEAARAGEAGKGFAVVADEVKKLAEQSKEASITINNIINAIQQKTEHTVYEANHANEIVKQQMGSVEDTDKAFKTIYNSMEGITSRLDNMQSSMKEMMHSKNKTVEAIESVSAVSEEAAATAQEVSASTQEQMAASEELANFARDLNDMAQELKKAMTIFKIDF